MKNLFSSPSLTPDFQKLFHNIQMLLDEQRHQRADMSMIKNQLHTLIKDIALQRQVDDYFDSNNRNKGSEPGIPSDEESEVPGEEIPESRPYE